MNKKILWVILAVAVVGAGVWAFSGDNAPTNSAEKMESGNTAGQQETDGLVPPAENDSQTETKDAAAPEGNGSQSGNESRQESGNETAPRAGAYRDYSTAALAEASKDGGKAVLFFWAAWCPFCKTANEAFTSRVAEIPAGVTVLKTNYDTEKELKTKYGVTYQHTFVQVDAEGKQIAKWNGGDIEALRANIK